VYIACDVK